MTHIIALKLLLRTLTQMKRNVKRDRQLFNDQWKASGLPVKTEVDQCK